MSYDHKISDLRYRINGLVPKNICKKIIDIFEKHPKTLGQNGYGHEKSLKFKTLQMEKDNFKCLNLSAVKNPSKEIVFALNEAKKFISIIIANYVQYIRTSKICPDFNDRLIKSSGNIRILKYDVGSYIGDHSDITELERASCTLNLNEEYEGGEFRFFDGQIKESFKTGDAMIFPAEPIWVHGTEPVTKGTRYCINCFLER